MRNIRYIPAMAVLAAALSSLPAQAVILENKWQAGQKLSYDVALDGSLNLNTAPDVPVLWAGVPLEVQLKGKGVGQMETTAVDINGTGTITVKVPQLSLQGEALGQKGELQFNNGKGKVLLNGKPLALGTGTENPLSNATALTNPPLAWKITRDGKLAGVQPTLPAAAPAAKAKDEEVPLNQAIDRGALIQAVVLRALPMLWPGRDIQQGETWHAIINWPQQDGTFAAKPLGDYQLTLDGIETVDGKDLYRVKVDGEMELDAAKLAQVNQEAVAAAKKGTTKELPSTVTAAGQKVKGLIWFDPAAGQVHHADLLLSARTRMRSQKPDGKPGDESWADFTGSLKLNLRPQV